MITHQEIAAGADEGFQAALLMSFYHQDGGRAQTALLSTQVFDKATSTAATWGNEGQDRQKRPGLFGVTSAQMVKEGKGFAAVSESFKPIFWQAASSLFILCGKRQSGVLLYCSRV
jgi:hypothetical protein